MFDSVLTRSTSKTESLRSRYIEVRQCSSELAANISEADAQIQAMPDVSPTKWHLAHTTWFFETFILSTFIKNYGVFNPSYNFLFNSYYNSIGEQFPRDKRGLISRPSLAEVLIYRTKIDEQIIELLDHHQASDHSRFMSLLELGLQHEQQHQELLLTDIKFNLFQNPTSPKYTDQTHIASKPAAPIEWLKINEGLYTVGQDVSDTSFGFDNEKPAHRVYLQPFDISNRLVTNEEYLAFIQAGAYQNPEYWLADGWAWLQNLSKLAGGQPKTAPLYWVKREGKWFEFTLHGLKAIVPSEPVTHVNYYEANAYANWCEARLPTEFEWEVAAGEFCSKPSLNAIRLHPAQTVMSSPLQQMFGELWQWTSSTYGAYPGFIPFTGNAGEYNGKFMSNQYVLRGSSCITPKGHARATYRNFFYAHQAWQFMGIRLVK